MEIHPEENHFKEEKSFLSPILKHLKVLKLIGGFPIAVQKTKLFFSKFDFDDKFMQRVQLKYVPVTQGDILLDIRVVGSYAVESSRQLLQIKSVLSTKCVRLMYMCVVEFEAAGRLGWRHNF